jgi:regulator of protease activity HflC (stomatin/prohibitin superfamily)
LIIDRERGPLTKDDVATLEKLADDVARASFLVNVDLTDRELRVRRLALEADNVKETIDHAIKDEKAYAAEEGRTDADKKASDARLKADEKARDTLADAVKKVKKADKDGALDKLVTQLQGDYDAAMDALKKKLKGKKS